MLDVFELGARSSPIAASTGAQRRLLVAEHGAAWPTLADTWREQGTQVSILIRRDGESEPLFVRRLSAAVAGAQLEGQPFDCAAMVVCEQLDAADEPARSRLLQLLAQSLLRAARPVVLQVHCAAAASAALCRSLERIQRMIAREFDDSAQLVLHLY